MVKRYLDAVNWVIDETQTIHFLKEIKNNYSTTSFRKRLYQIRKFLLYLKIEWAKQLKAPPEPSYNPKRITFKDIHKALDYFQGHRYYKQIKAIIYLGATTGLRAEEVYQLEQKDIDLDSRIISVNHNPDNGQTTKTGESRIAIFSKEAKKALEEYLGFFESNERLLRLFSITHVERLFRNAPIKVKELRKFFSQQWDRNGGSTGIKKMLMGHSGDVDTYHYNAQNQEDLMKIYDKINIKIDYGLSGKQLKKRGIELVKYIEKKIDYEINIEYKEADSDCDGQTICKDKKIIIYWNKSDWDWLKEVIIHECAHRLDCKYRGKKHHMPQYKHDKHYWRCYNEIMKLVEVFYPTKG